MNKGRKVWILTRRAGYNFGTSLQAYAMTCLVRKLGYENQMIRFDEYRLRGKIRLMCWDIAYLAMRVLPFLFRAISPRFFQSCKDFYCQRRKFHKFEKEYYPLTRQRFNTSRQLALAAVDCDILLCGSDQIWSPAHFNSTMFLDFADNEKTKTIAYAPSIGLNKIERHKEEIASLVKRIDYVSVRESRGAEMLKELTGRNVFVALDPTLMLTREDWLQLAVAPSITEKYILCYFLDTENMPYRFLRSIAEKTGYKLINLQTNYSRLFLSRAENKGDVSPGEFIGWVAHAVFVCTNSFHGTIFSILFGKKFYVFDRFSSHSVINQNSRIDTLLETLSLQDRRFSIKKEYRPEEEGKFNYEEVYRLLQKKREESFDFLSNAFKDLNAER